MEMKIRFLATGNAPVRYEIAGDVITAYELYIPPPPPEPEPDPDTPMPEPEPVEPPPEEPAPDPDAPPPEPLPEPEPPPVSIMETFDFSLLQFGGEFEGVEPAIINIPATQIIRSAYRDELGILHVELCQKISGGGAWIESDWIDATDFVPDTRYIYRSGEVNPLAPVPIPDPTPEPTP